MSKVIAFITLLGFMIGIGVYSNKADRIPPMIIVDENIELTYHIGDEIPNLLSHIQVTDDKNDSSFVVDTSDIDMNQFGEYPLVITAKDSKNNKSTYTLMIKIEDLKAPIISGYKDRIYVVGETTPAYLDGVSVLDDYEAITTKDIHVDDSQVDYQKAGIYPVLLTASDGANIAKVYTKTIVVEQDIVTTYNFEIGNTINIMDIHFQPKTNPFITTWSEDAYIIHSVASSGDVSSSFSSFTYKDMEKEFENYTFTNEVLERQFNDVVELVKEHENLSVFISGSIKFLDVFYRKDFFTLSPSYNLDSYQDKVNETFESSLQDLMDEAISFTTFFETYGTHVITEISYGRSYSLICLELSKNIILNRDEYACDDNSLTTIGEMSSTLTTSDTNRFTALSLVKTGAVNIIRTTENNYDLMSNWYQDNENNMIIDFGVGNRGLKPIYMLVPDELSSLKEEMILAFNEYTKEKVISITN